MMKFKIHGNKVEITEAIKSYIENKLGKLDKYFENPEEITASVVIRVRGFDQIVEVTIPIKKVILRGEETHKDMYAAIDLVLEKIERQIRKNKTRMKQKGNKETYSSFNLNFENEKEEEENEAKIVKRKEIEMKPMSEEEAILQMNLLGHEFFVFHEIESGQSCVLYRRKDGNYGIIATK